MFMVRACYVSASSAALAALYLPGSPAWGCSPRRWLAVLGALEAGGEAVRALRSQSFWEEAARLEVPGALEWARRVLAAGDALTAACPGYPVRWSERLGAAAPAALWQSGPLPSGLFVAVVGSRRLSPPDSEFAFGVGRALALAGYVLVSGGAAGADTQAALGAQSAGGSVLELLPCGLGSGVGRRGCAASVCAPGAPFSSASAMQRNAVIYALAEAAVVVAPRFRQGGTWHGAIEARRRRLCPLLVRPVPGCPASAALLALGARPLAAPSGLELALAEASLVCAPLGSPPAQPALFEGHSA